MANFAAQVADWVAARKEYHAAVFHTASQAVVEEMQRPGPSRASTAKAAAKSSMVGPPAPSADQGGRLPVDTGFLWHSLTASNSTMPQMSEAAKPAKDASYSYDAGPVNLLINNTPVGGKIFCGYVAAYAAKVNYSYGYMFVDLAAQRWPQFVKAAEQELASRLGR